MNKYNSFLALFIISAVTFIIFIVFYLNGIMSFIFRAEEHQYVHLSPWEFFHTFFNPPFLISVIVFGFSSLACRILGIVYVAQNKTAGDGEKALWIIGFILMGFVTSIVFLVMAKGRKFVE